jgi:hypothetical protein
MFENLDLRSSSTIILLIPLAFIVGAIASESLAFAAKETMGKPFLEIWDAIQQVEDSLPKIYTIEETFLFNTMEGDTKQLTCKSGYIIIGADFDTDISIFTPGIDIQNQKFSVFVLNMDTAPKELHMSLSCLAV